MRARVRWRFSLWLPMLVGVIAGLCVARGARAGDYGKIYAEGLKHSRRAATLAGANNCRAAVPEYTKALKLLKDPVLLFNRAECYRTLGDRAAALADYRRFLFELPAAPNRAQVEAHIAKLDAPVPLTTAAAVAAPVKASPPPPSLPSPEKVEAAPAPLSVADFIDTRPDPTSSEAAPPPAVDLAVAALPPNPSPDLVSVDPSPLPLGAETDSRRPITGRWWFWTALATVLVGGSVATYLGVRANRTDIPSSELGNYKF